MMMVTRKENMNSATVWSFRKKIKHKTEGDEGFICMRNENFYENERVSHYLICLLGHFSILTS